MYIYYFRAGISDIAASLFIMSFSLGSLVGPFSGGATYDHFGGNVDWSSAI
jgi:predicted MFS family arabinose efflux permease